MTRAFICLIFKKKKNNSLMISCPICNFMNTFYFICNFSDEILRLHNRCVQENYSLISFLEKMRDTRKKCLKLVKLNLQMWQCHTHSFLLTSQDNRISFSLPSKATVLHVLQISAFPPFPVWPFYASSILTSICLFLWYLHIHRILTLLNWPCPQPRTNSL